MLNALEDIFMVHQINDAGNIKHIEPDNRLKAKQNETAPAIAEHSALYDSVNLSATSKQLEALKASLQDIPEINEARVAYFKAEIQSGNYRIHSDKIAMNMLNNTEMA
jgi:negative regulator of flagellin synthesis FlgM